MEEKFGGKFKFWPMAGATSIVFFLLFTVLNVIGFVPEIDPTLSEAVEFNEFISDSNAALVVGPTFATEAKKEQQEAIHPTRIIIDAIDVDSTVENPQSRDVAILDEALLSGVVHYPGSGTLTDDNNMFLFGHSSGLPVVHNQAFKVFNKLSDLEAGNTIRVQGGGVENVYRVTKVELADASDALVSFKEGKKQLTLSTCNSFGSKSERFVVTADFVGSYSL